MYTVVVTYIFSSLFNTFYSLLKNCVSTPQSVWYQKIVQLIGGLKLSVFPVSIFEPLHSCPNITVGLNHSLFTIYCIIFVVFLTNFN